MGRILIRHRLDPDNVLGISSIAWTQQATTSPWPGYNGYLGIRYDAVSQRTFFYVTTTGTTIYSSDLYSYASASNAFTRLGGNNSIDNAASGATSNDGSWPKDRHPVQQMAIDTTRNRLYLISGLVQNNPIHDTWYLTLNAAPAEDTWTKVALTTNPGPVTTGAISGAAVYSPHDDVLFMFGTDSSAQTSCNWVFAPGSSLSAAQTAAGCSANNEWYEVAPVGGVQPSGVQYPVMIYLPNRRKVWLFGGRNSGNTANLNEVWEYDIPTKTWAQHAPASSPVVVPSTVDSPPTFAVARWGTTDKVVYHQTHGTGAPKDWEYNPDTQTWTAIVSTGSGPTGSGNIGQVEMAYDVSAGKFVTWSKDTEGSGVARVWHGVVT